MPPLETALQGSKTATRPLRAAAWPRNGASRGAETEPSRAARRDQRSKRDPLRRAVAARGLLLLTAMRESVLIVDDDPSTRRGLKTVLETVGVRVCTASDLDGAWAELSYGNFDLVLADLSLNGASGREGFALVDRLRDSQSHTPIVVFTAHGSPSVRDEALARGANDLWSKSISIEALIERVLRYGHADE